MFLCIFASEITFWMYYTLIQIHSVFRWILMMALPFAVLLALRGVLKRKLFSRTDDLVRHWTATIAHVQLLIGMLLYTQSSLVSYFWQNKKEAMASPDHVFFGLIHISLMLIAIVILTIGSSLTKRRKTDQEKYRTMLFCYGLALLIMLVAIPWPFSPLASRPYYR